MRLRLEVREKSVRASEGAEKQALPKIHLLAAPSSSLLTVTSQPTHRRFYRSTAPYYRCGLEPCKRPVEVRRVRVKMDELHSQISYRANIIPSLLSPCPRRAID